MDDFRSMVNELVLVDVKSNKGWFTWMNNRRGNELVNERLDRLNFSLVYRSIIGTMIVRDILANW